MNLIKMKLHPYKSSAILFFLFFISPGAFSQVRERLPLNKGWDFHFAYDVRRDALKEKVDLPHTWNRADEVTAVKMDYKRDAGIYEKKLDVKKEWREKRLFLFFEGTNSTAQVFVNQHLLGEHTGGYTAFCLEITDAVKYGEENLLTVEVNNAYNRHVLPLSGDFNIYGGIHRPVSLLVTDKNCITPLDFASPGVYLSQKNVSGSSAEVEVLTKLSLSSPGYPLSVKTSILDAQQKIIAEKVTLLTKAADSVKQNIVISKPHLWDAKTDPYLYQAKVQLIQDKKVIDEIIQPLGLRYYHVDPEKGFFLNGRYLDLYGVCRHQDVADRGSALSEADHEKDMGLIKEIGANALRLTHYPHSEYFYDLCDQNGLVVWTEIPFVGPGGYTGPGYIKSPALEQHAKEKMRELIRQNYNHPSIIFWGLFNELKLDYDDPVPFLKELNAVAKQEDPSRLTTCASFGSEPTFNEVSDVIAWNKYFGWYGGKPEEMGKWTDMMHQKFPEKPIAISEYGAGASIHHHQEILEAPQASGNFHPEEWQTYYHEKNWEILKARPYLWGKFIWVLADFGSSIRNEGDTPGINDKGLVTYDRKTKKDAFYFYKANWNPEPMLYITERRNQQRTKSITSVKVYTTAPYAELTVNGKLIGKKAKDEMNTIRWEGVKLSEGVNKIQVKSTVKGKVLLDNCEWELIPAQHKSQ